MTLNSLLNLVLDNNFQKIEQSASTNSFFKIVGRTHTETWHSMFLSWILDPHASHEMDFFSLKKLLLNCTRDNNFCDLSKTIEITKIIASDNIKILRQYPTEKNQSEYVVSGIGRFDIFIEIEYTSLLNKNKPFKAIILLEQKVKDPISEEQCARYLNYLETDPQYKEHLILPIFLSSSEQLEDSSKNTYGSEKWFGLTYQDIYDSILRPAQTNLDISPKAHAAILDYIETLKMPIGERKLIMTDEEKELAKKIFDDHKEAFYMLREILKDVEPDIVDCIPVASDREKIQIIVNGETISGVTVPDFYRSCMEFLFSKNKEKELLQKLPIPTSNVRYLISSDGIHQGGNTFYSPLQIKEGIVMETHANRAGGMRFMTRLLRGFGFKVE